jgi:hypothetical protein
MTNDLVVSMDKFCHMILKIYNCGLDYKFGLNYTTLNLNDSNDK